jgi:phospholipid/cholesterol/gamma-HCH transport system substrate-binding protein
MSGKQAKRDLTNLRVGAAVLVGIILIVFGSLWGQDMLRRTGTLTFSVEFDSGFGLNRGDPVLIAGVKKGQVTRIQLTPQNRVWVDLRLDDDVQLDTASMFTIESEGLIGVRYINVISGGVGRPVAEGDTLQGINAAGLNDVFRSVQIIMAQIGELAGTMQTLLTDQDVRVQLAGMADNFNRTVGLLNQVMIDNQDLVSESLQNLSDVVETINAAVLQNMDDLEAALKSIRLAGDHFVLAADSVDSLSTVLTGLTARVGRGEGTLWKMAESDSLYVQLLSTVGRLDSLLVDIRKNPQRFFLIRIF